MDKDEARAKFLTQSLDESNEPRWGYFGMCGPLAIGDNSLGLPTLRKEKTEAEEAAEPLRNIQTCALKKGNGADAYFSLLPPLAVDEPFIDSYMYSRRPRVHMLDPEASFKPPGKIKHSTNTLGYEYMEHMVDNKDPKETYEKYKEYVPLRNFYTNAAKKGGGGVYPPGVLFGNGEDRALYEYMEDPYDNAKMLRRKEFDEHKAKCHEQPFRDKHYGNQAFQVDTEVYHVDGPTHVPREVENRHVNKYPHEMPFRPAHPAKKGLNAPMNEFPEWFPEPVKETQVRRADPNEAVPPAWRPCHPRQVHNPMPSVTTSMRNMRAERASSFMRPSLGSLSAR